MNGIFSKVLIGISLAVVLALAVPLTMMTLSVLHGESPQQLAVQEPDPEDPAEPADDGAPSDSQPSQTFPYPKPVVQPDSGSPAGESEADDEPEESAKARPPVSAPKSGRAKASTSYPAQTAPAAETPAAPTAPVEEKPKNTLPKAVLAPGEAPCLVDGLDGYSYDY